MTTKGRPGGEEHLIGERILQGPPPAVDHSDLEVFEDEEDDLTPGDDYQAEVDKFGWK